MQYAHQFNLLRAGEQMKYRMQHTLAFIGLLLCATVNGTAQDIRYAKEVIDTMTAPGMHGRGYVERGDLRAAEYLRKEFRKHQLQPVGDRYFQPFSFSVNTFPGDVAVSINGKPLTPGVDYLVDPHSGKKKGTYNIFPITSANYRGSLDKLKNSFLLIDKSKSRSEEEKAAMDLWITDPQGASGVILIEEHKLTWSVSRQRFKYPVIRILRASLPADAAAITVRIRNKYCKKYRTQNVIGMFNGASQPDTFIVFSAHYDHLGRMGRDTYFPGANDNASGVSMLLNLAAHYNLHRPYYSTLFIAFAGEEAGLMGSAYYVKNPLIPLPQMKFLVNMDLLGTGDDGLMVVNGAVYKKAFARMDTINRNKGYVKSLQKRGRARNSDHFWFSENGVPAFFIYTLGGVAHYHDIKDVAATLPLTDYDDVFRLVRDFADGLSGHE